MQFSSIGPPTRARKETLAVKFQPRREWSAADSLARNSPLGAIVNNGSPVFPQFPGSPRDLSFGKDVGYVNIGDRDDIRGKKRRRDVSDCQTAIKQPAISPFVRFSQGKQRIYIFDLAYLESRIFFPIINRPGDFSRSLDIFLFQLPGTDQAYNIFVSRVPFYHARYRSQAPISLLRIFAGFRTR